MDPAYQPPVPTLHFDKASYGMYDTAFITLEGNHLVCNYNTGNIVMIQLAFYQTGFTNPLASIKVPLSLDDTNTKLFKGTMKITDLLSQLRSQLKADSPVIPPDSQIFNAENPSQFRMMASFSPVQCNGSPIAGTSAASAIASSSQYSISFDHPVYGIETSPTHSGNDQGSIKIVDSSGSSGNCPNLQSGSVSVLNKANQVFQSFAFQALSPPTGQGVNLCAYSASFKILKTTTANTPIPPGNIVVNPSGDMLTATFRGASATAAVLPSTGISFDRDVYYADDRAVIKLNDSSLNTDPTKVDTAQVRITSNQGGKVIDNMVMAMRETGPNTGIFASSYFLSFNTTAPDGNNPIPRESSIRIASTGDTTIRVTGDFRPTTGSGPSGLLQGTVNVHSALRYVGTLSSASSGQGGSGFTPTPGNQVPSGGTSEIPCDTYGKNTTNDGICNYWKPGGQPLKVPYPAGGAYNSFPESCDPTCPDTTKKDIYVEIDYYGSNKPNSNALTNVKNAFSTSPVGNIRLHLEVGEDISQNSHIGGSYDYTKVLVWGNATGSCWTGGTSGCLSFDTLKFWNFGTSAEQTTSWTAGWSNKLQAKKQVYHYGLFVPYQAQDSQSSGNAEITGNDFIVSLGSYYNGVGSVDQQQGTLMHELGHNLGLNHGGPDALASVNPTINCKPNYLSVMSYPRQFTNAFANNTLNYSDDPMSPGSLDLTNLGESAGLQLTTSAQSNGNITWGVQNGQLELYSGISKNPEYIDWDNDGSGLNTNDADSSTQEPWVTSPPYNIPDVSQNLYPCNNIQANLGTATTLPGANDWSNLIYSFRSANSATFSNGQGNGLTEFDLKDLRAMRVSGINTLNYLVQTLNIHYFANGTVNGKSVVPSLVKQDFQNELFGNPATNYYIKDNVTKSVATLLQQDDVQTALNKMLLVRSYMDGYHGGAVRNDLFNPLGENAILPFMDNNIAEEKIELDKPYKDKTFTITSQTSSGTYTIKGNSSSITSLADTFTIDPTNKRISLRFVGQGDVTLYVPRSLATGFNGVEYEGTPEHISNGVTGNSTYTILNLKNLHYYPKMILGAYCVNQGNITYSANCGSLPGQPLTVSTNKQSYSGSETIVISGGVTPVAGQALLIEVFNPNGVLYRADTITPASDGTYSYDMKIGGRLGPSGTYTVVVYYNNQKAQTTFSYTNTNTIPPSPGPWHIVTVQVNGASYQIQYAISAGGTISSISADTGAVSLKASITSTSSGTLALKIPRNVLDSKTANGTDDDFVIFADGVPTANYNESGSDSTQRTIYINFDQGTQTIEIVGTHIVPEFGASAIVSIMLAIAIVGTIIAARHNRNSWFSNR